MSQFNFSSSPLTTLFPNFSTQKEPNYNGAFQMDIGQLKSSTSPMPNYAQDFLQQSQPQVNQMKLYQGFTSLDSTDPLVRLNGTNTLDEMLGPASSGSQVFPTEDNTRRPLSERLSSSRAQRNLGLGAAGLDMANTLFTGIFGEKDEYQGAKGDITQTADSFYDSIQSTVKDMGPIGQVASLVLGGNKLLSNVANKLGAGTDGMTTADALLGSSFLQLTPFGIINGLGGQKADTISKNENAFEKVGASYGGTNAIVDDALTKSGKKYGLFSNKARLKANKEISTATTQQNIMSDIADTATKQFSLQDSMAAVNNNKRAFNLYGGFNAANTRVGRHGMSLQVLNRAKEISSKMKKFQVGGTISDPFTEYLQSLPEDQRDSTNYRVRDYWEYNGRPKNFEEAKKKGMFVLEEDFDTNGKSLGKFWHAFTVAKNPNVDEYDFMKSSSHPTIQKELDWYNSDNPDAISFRRDYELQKVEPYYKYVRRKTPYVETPKRKNGGSIIELAPIPTEILLVDPSEIPEFQEGGSINVIPEGALHARKHNMDVEGITKKGIPVVTNKEGEGEVEQQAEIEREEIIFRLEVTKKLEELQKKYYNSETTKKEKEDLALEAGKLLVEEILYNTIDNTNNLL